MELLFIYERRLLELNTELPDPPNVTILLDIIVSYPAAAQVGGKQKTAAQMLSYALTHAQPKCWAILGIYPSTNRIFERGLIFMRIACCSGLYAVLCDHDICNSVISALSMN